MERLKGPFGMYGTVYGINTAVIHVAHPVPARAIFGTATCKTSASISRSEGSPSSQRRYSVANSTGASKAPAYNHFKNFCGEGVFTADGEDWKAKRASLMHCLIRGTNSAVSDASIRLENEVNRAADEFISQIQQLQKSSNRSQVVTNVVPLLQRCTLGFIYRYITHDEPSWAKSSLDGNDDTLDTTSLLSSSESSFAATNCDKVEQRSTDRRGTLLDRYLTSVVRIRMIILAQSRSIWFVLPSWCYSTFSSLYKDEETTLLPIREFAEQACQCAQPGSPLGKLQTMESHVGTGRAKLSKFSKDVLDETITLLFAGQDTSAATLSWIVHLLSIHPEIQARLAKEVQTVVTLDKQSSSNIRVTRAMIANLPFLHAVVQESMRLYPVAPFVVRRLQDDVYVDGEEKSGCSRRTVLPADSVACIWIYSLHRNPDLWDRPNDFVPDRWLGETKDEGQVNGAYMPFAAGPRNCVGQPIAHVVLRTLLARLILQYDFYDERLAATANGGDLRIEMQAGFTVLPSGGVSVKIRPRGQ
jgi:Cytochrome P450